MTVPSTDSERAPTRAAPTPERAAPRAERPASPAETAPHRLPRRAAALPVRQRNRVALETLEATFAGLQQVDEEARPAAPLAPPADLWPPVTGSHQLVTGSQPRVSG